VKTENNNFYLFPLTSLCRSTSTIRCYNVLALGLAHPSMGESLLPACNELQPIQVADIFRPALALPLKATSKVTQTQAALHLLCCLDSLTRYQEVPPKETKAHETQKNMISRCYTKEDFSLANRFESKLQYSYLSLYKIEYLKKLYSYFLFLFFSFRKVTEEVGVIRVILWKQFASCLILMFSWVDFLFLVVAESTWGKLK